MIWKTAKHGSAFGKKNFGKTGCLLHHISKKIPGSLVYFRPAKVITFLKNRLQKLLGLAGMWLKQKYRPLLMCRLKNSHFFVLAWHIPQCLLARWELRPLPSQELAQLLLLVHTGWPACSCWLYYKYEIFTKACFSCHRNYLWTRLLTSVSGLFI